MRPPYDFAEATFMPFNLGSYFWRVMAWGSLLMVIASMLFIPLWLSDFKDFFALVTASANTTNPDDIFAFMGLMGKMFLKAIPLMLLLWAIMASILTAFHKQAILGIQEQGFPLKFGKTEFSVMLSQLVVGLIIAAAFFIGYLLIFAVAVAAGSGSSSGFAGLIGFLIGLPLVCFLIFLAVRLSTVVPETVKNGRVAIGEGWRASKGRFWWMLLSFIVLGIIGYIINFILQLILQFTAMAVFATRLDTNALEAGDFSGLMDTITSPLFIIVVFIIFLVFQFVSMSIQYFSHGVTAYVTRGGAGGGDPSAVADIYN